MTEPLQDTCAQAGARQRIPIPKRLRFEVFKRDKFTCQYCGAKAPDVLLECDHVRPVADDGDNDVLNLITACADCNRGKGAISLADDAALRKQQDALADLEERRQQIEMMLEWRDSLQGLKEDTVSAVVARIAERGPGRTPSDQGRAKIKRWLARFTVAEMLAATDAAFDSYAEFAEDGETTEESWQTAFNRIPNIVVIQRDEKDKPHLPRLFYIRKVVSNKTGAVVSVDFLEYLRTNGWDLDLLERHAKSSNRISQFVNPIEEALAEAGVPYPGGRPWRWAQS